MDYFVLAEEEHSPIAEHTCGAGALLYPIIAVNMEQTSNWKIRKVD